MPDMTLSVLERDLSQPGQNLLPCGHTSVPRRPNSIRCARSDTFRENFPHSTPDQPRSQRARFSHPVTNCLTHEYHCLKHA